MTNEQLKAEKERLLSEGYKPFEPGELDHSGIVKKYQKCFSDDVGKKYFITAHEWDFGIDEKDEGTFEYEVYFSRKETENPVKILFYGGYTSEQVEKDAEKMFQSGMWEYYEIWY